MFGNGRTAVKFRWGKYLGFAVERSAVHVDQPGRPRWSRRPNRGWTDNDSDKVVDCDLLNNAAQSPTTGQVDTCAAATGNGANFGQARRGDHGRSGAAQAAGACARTTTRRR